MGVGALKPPPPQGDVTTPRPTCRFATEAAKAQVGLGFAPQGRSTPEMETPTPQLRGGIKVTFNVLNESLSPPKG